MLKEFVPSYLKLGENELKRRVDKAYSLLSPCVLCPRECRVMRDKGEVGTCRADSRLFVSSYNLHFGEEPPISGRNGSGTIFLTHCLSRCVYCQNYPISQMGNGNETTPEELASMMIYLQNSGAHNINFVTPTHYVPQIVHGIYLASKRGLNIPIVYNTFGYESLEVLRLLEGIIDIYMPDMRYSDNRYAARYSAVKDYVEHNREAVKEMYRQVGDLKLVDGVAVRGLLVRLLVLPNGVSGTEESLRFLREEVSQDTYISLMDQYFPAYKAHKYSEISRFITHEEYESVLNCAKEFRGWIQNARGYG